jgi:catechol 2,3-dioxygenase-like lactoylglutathione lyase family enzyme
MRIRLDHVQIAAPPGCEAEARRFFGSLIGLREVEKPGPLAERGGVWFEVGDRQLHVGADSDFTPASRAHPAFSLPTADLEMLAGRLEDEGADVDWDANLPDRRRFHSRDPWGNRIEFLADRA